MEQRSAKFGWLVAATSLIAVCGPGDALPGGNAGDVSLTDVGTETGDPATDTAGSSGSDAANGAPDVPSGSDDASDDIETFPGTDAATADAGPGDDRLRVDSTSAALQTTFTANITGTLGQRLGDAELTVNVGYVEIDGVRLPTFGYRVQEWANFGLTLVQSIAAREDALFPLWFYCSGDQLDGVYIEGTDGTPSTWIPASSGTCDVEMTPTMGVVDLPALSIEPPAAEHDFEVTGDLTVSPGEAGTFTAGGRTWQTFGFETIDCTTECGTPGWWELHALLWDSERRDLCFSIFYLYESDRDSSVAYTMCLPTLEDLVGDRPIVGEWSR